MTRLLSSPTAPLRRGPGLGLVALLLASGVTGCYRAGGVPKNTPIAYEIPATGGDRVAGIKSTGGPGDYYLGNDYVQMAVDGAPYGERSGQFGAYSGGGILDVGAIGLDQSFHRVSVPADNLDQLMPVVNQDPDLPLVFDTYRPSSSSDSAVLEMHGGLMDPKGKLGAPTDSKGRVIGVEVIHTISLAGRSRNFDLSTILINHTTSALPIYTLGDYLHQRGGGFRIVVPGQETSGFAPSGSYGTPAPVSTWGVQIPGSDFSTTTAGVEDPAKRFNPLATAVKAHGLGLQGAEPSADSLDNHQSLGIASLDESQVLVTSEAQDTLNELRPKFPSRVAVGRLPQLDATTHLPTTLAANGSLTFNRRLYTVSSNSSAYSFANGTGGVYPLLPMQTAQVFNEMAEDRNVRFGESIGSIFYIPFGTAARSGPFPTEVRFERYDPTAARWVLESVDVAESGELHDALNARPALLPSPDAAHPATPTNPYRITLRNKLFTQSFGSNGTTQLPEAQLTDGSSTRVSSYRSLLVPMPTYPFSIIEPIAPEAGPGIGGGIYGNVVGTLQVPHLVNVYESNSDISVIQPARVLVQALNGSGAPDPANNPTLRRSRLYLGQFSPLIKGKFRSAFFPGLYQFRAGNEIFGSNFGLGYSDTSALQAFPLFPGNYKVSAIRGPLSSLDTKTFSSKPNDSVPIHILRLTNGALPTGWVSFDLPSTTQSTTGGMLPAEMMASALAENINVVGRTEEDLLTSPTGLYNDFRVDFAEIYSTAAQRAVVGLDPLVVGARTSTLWNPAAPTPVLDGRATSLFTAEPSADRMGGARASKGWNLADFIANAEGTFTVIHRPRNPGSVSDPTVPKGLFAAHGFNPTVALGTGANAWWTQTGPLSGGKRIGDFDALELIRAEYSDTTGPLSLTVGSNATAWFNEFKAVRTDWFSLLKQQTPTSFTKALGLSAANYSYDTPVGLARTYLNLANAIDQSTLGPVLDALKAGRAVASTGPFLDVQVGDQGPGGFLTGTNASASLAVTVYAPDWVPVDEVRVVVNGSVVSTIPFNATNFTQDTFDKRKWVLTNAAFTTLTFTPGKDAFVVVEAGVPLSTSGAYAAGSPWALLMKGIYPIAVANPIFVDVNGGGYVAPGLP